MSKPTTTRSTLKPVTAAQLEAPHAIGRRRGIGRIELRETAGVRESLKELSVVDASKLIHRLQTEGHRNAYPPPPPARAARGAIKMASARQRTKIVAFFDQLGWPDGKAIDWLLKYRAIRDLAAGVFMSMTTSDAITQLEQFLSKEEARADDQAGLEPG